MEMITKSALVCLLCAVFALTLKKTVPDLAFGIQTAGVVLVAVVAFRVLTPIYDFLKECARIFCASGVYVAPVLKASLIGVLTCIGSALCKDAGQSGLASSLELLGCAAAVYTALPLLELFVHTIGEML